MHHKSGESCPLCELKLSQAHPEIANWFRFRVKVKWPNAHVAWAFRGEEDQNKAFSEGKSKLKWPESKHNRTDAQGRPCSYALDLFQIDDGKAIFSQEWYLDVWEKVQRDASPIRWGGTWKSFPDFPHFEIREN